MSCGNVELRYLMVWQHLCYKECFQKFIMEDILLLLHDSICTHFYQTLSTLALYTREVFPVTVSLDSALRLPVPPSRHLWALCMCPATFTLLPALWDRALCFSGSTLQLFFYVFPSWPYKLQCTPVLLHFNYHIQGSYCYGKFPLLWEYGRRKAFPLLGFG